MLFFYVQMLFKQMFYNYIYNKIINYGYFIYG